MQDSILNVVVSLFESYMDTNPKQVILLHFLMSQDHAAKIIELRQHDDKAKRDAIKKTLPAITPSGEFTQRKESGLIRHSGFMQMDIDAKDNPVIFDGCETLADYAEILGMVKDELSKFKEVAYAGLSASGRGLWLLVPIEQPARHKDHFKALAADLERLGIIVDSAPSNVASLRGYSYDPDAYYNHNATPYTRLYTPEKKPVTDQVPHAVHTSPAGNEAEKVKFILDQINRRGADITNGYQTWFSIGCALANEFGESGRGYFHDVSRNHPEYDYSKADKQFTHCLKGTGYTIATFYTIAAQHGFTYKEAFTRRDAPQQPTKPSTPVEKPQPTILPIKPPPVSKGTKIVHLAPVDGDWWRCWYHEQPKPEGWDTNGLPEGWVKIDGVLHMIVNRKFWDLSTEPILLNYRGSDQFDTPLEKAAFALEFERAVKAREYCPYCETPEAHLQGCLCGNIPEPRVINHEWYKLNEQEQLAIMDTHFDSVAEG